MFWLARTAKYNGNQSDKFGRYLTYRVRTNARGPSLSDADVYLRLRGAGKTIFVDHTTVGRLDPNQWKTVSIKLDSSVDWKTQNGSGQTVVALNQDIQHVLSNVKDLWIKGEYGDGADIGCLDDVEFGAESAGATIAPARTAVREPAEQFRPLFNGRDIVGWTAWGQRGRLSHKDAARFWSVHNGVLHGNGGLSHLFSPRNDYRDFRVRAEVKINDGGNSGVHLRVAPGPGYLKGYEAQINSTHTDPNKTGSLYRVPQPPIQVSPSPVPTDTWFTLEAEAVAARIRVWVNGKLTADWVDPSKTYTHGHIAIQAHHPGSHVQIRNLEVMELNRAGKTDSVERIAN